MRKWLVPLAAAIALLALGTGAYAAANNGGSAGTWDMFAHMKQVHPNLSDDQIQAMYDRCAKSNSNVGSMMNGGAGMMGGYAK